MNYIRNLSNEELELIVEALNAFKNHLGQKFGVTDGFRKDDAAAEDIRIRRRMASCDTVAAYIQKWCIHPDDT